MGDVSDQVTRDRRAAILRAFDQPHWHRKFPGLPVDDFATVVLYEPAKIPPE